jgi:hypothetical protein
MNNILMKVRPLADATADSKRKAQLYPSRVLRPFKSRPATTSFVASKLIGASLGITSQMDKDKLNQEKKKLQSARGEPNNY